MNSLNSNLDMLIEVGHIADAFGLQGAVKVFPYSNDPQGLLIAKKWELQPSKNPHLPGQIPLDVKVMNSQLHGSFVVAHIADIRDRDEALKLKGMVVCIRRKQLPSLQEDEFYWVDLIGCSVYDTDNVLIGIVSNLIDNGSQQILCVDRSRGIQTQSNEAASASLVQTDAPDKNRIEDVLIPFVDRFIISVEISQRRITVDWEWEA